MINANYNIFYRQQKCEVEEPGEDITRNHVRRRKSRKSESKEMTWVGTGAHSTNGSVARISETPLGGGEKRKTPPGSLTSIPIEDNMDEERHFRSMLPACIELNRHSTTETEQTFIHPNENQPTDNHQADDHENDNQPSDHDKTDQDDGDHEEAGLPKARVRFAPSLDSSSSQLQDSADTNDTLEKEEDITVRKDENMD